MDIGPKPQSNKTSFLSVLHHNKNKGKENKKRTSVRIYIYFIAIAKPNTK